MKRGTVRASLVEIFRSRGDLHPSGLAARMAGASLEKDPERARTLLRSIVTEETRSAEGAALVAELARRALTALKEIDHG